MSCIIRLSVPLTFPAPRSLPLLAHSVQAQVFSACCLLKHTRRSHHLQLALPLPAMLFPKSPQVSLTSVGLSFAPPGHSLPTHSKLTGSQHSRSPFLVHIFLQHYFPPKTYILLSFLNCWSPSPNPPNNCKLREDMIFCLFYSVEALILVE